MVAFTGLLLSGQRQWMILQTPDSTELSEMNEWIWKRASNWKAKATFINIERMSCQGRSIKQQNNLYSDGLCVPEMKPEFTGLSDVQWVSTFQSVRPSYLFSTNFQSRSSFPREGNGTPLQYCCLENPMDGGAWQALVHGIAKSRTRLSDFTFHFHALKKEMATHSSVLAWKIPWMEEPGRL